MLNLYGEVSYNGFVFPGTYEVSVKMDTTYASDGFNQKWDMYEFTIKFIFTGEMTPGVEVNAQGSIDHSIQQLRAVLMQRGGLFTYNYQGLAPSFKVSSTANVGNSVMQDIAGGPKPISFQFEPIGTNTAAAIIWVVQVHLPACSGIRDGNLITVLQPFSEFYYKRSIDLDAAGICTLTTTGYYELRDPTANIDSKRGLLFFPTVPGMVRETKSFEIQADHKSANFSFVDREVPGTNAYYKYSVKIEASHTMGSNLMRSGKLRGAGFLTWDNDIEATITVPKSQYTDLAFHIFLHILRQRLYRVKPFFGRFAGQDAETIDEKEGNQPQKPRAYLTKLRMTENLFSNTHSFAASYYAVYNREYFLNQSGLFRPLFSVNQKEGKLSDWWELNVGFPFEIKEPWDKDFNEFLATTTIDKQWLYYQGLRFTDSSVGRMFDNFGRLYVRETNLDTPSIIFDPCGVPSYPNEIEIKQPYSEPFNLHRGPIYESLDGERDIYPSNKPIYGYEEKTSSYIDYNVSISVVEKTNTYQLVKQCYDASVQNVLQSGGTSSSPYTKATDKFSINNNAQITSGYTNSVKRTSSYSSGSNFSIVMSGHSVRVGWPSPVPSLLSFDGKGLYKGGESIYTQKQLGGSNKPVYMAAWSIPYLVDSDPVTDIFGKLIGSHSTGNLS